MNGFLLPIFVVTCFMMGGTAYAIPLSPEDAELNSPALDYTYGYPAMEKRQTRPTLNEYLRLAAIQYELDKEEAEAADAQNAAEALAEASPSGETLNPETHSVDKRRRRYGFWVTAINKMGGGNLKSFLGKHKNIYNVYKRKAMGNVV